MKYEGMLGGLLMALAICTLAGLLLVLTASASS